MALRRPRTTRRGHAGSRFVPLWNLQVAFEYRERRVDCPNCGARVERLPWARPYARLCSVFAQFLSTRAKRLSVDQRGGESLLGELVDRLRSRGGDGRLRAEASGSDRYRGYRQSTNSPSTSDTATAPSSIRSTQAGSGSCTSLRNGRRHRFGRSSTASGRNERRRSASIARICGRRISSS